MDNSLLFFFIVVALILISALLFLPNNAPRWFIALSNSFDSCGMRLLIATLSLVCFISLSVIKVNAESPICNFTETQKGALHEASTTYKIPVEVLVAMAIVESNCNQKAVGAAGEIGLLQIMPRDAGLWYRDRPSASELRDEYINIVTAAWILRENIDRYCNGFPESSKVMCGIGVYNGGTSVFFTGFLNAKGQLYANKVKSFIPVAVGMNFVKEK